jgi:two-component system, LytTR family, sensor kinase
VLVLTLCVWAAYFVLSNTLTYLVPGQAMSLGVLGSRLVIACCGVAFCLCMHALLRRWGGTRPWPLLSMAMCLSAVPAGLLVLTGMYAFRALTPYYEVRPGDWMDPYLMGWNFVSHLWMLFTWSALYVGATVVLEMRRRDAQLAAARSAAQQAQLLALRLQINPHFLFNTLNTLAGFIVLGRREESEKIVLDLSRFLRHTLTRSQSQLVPVQEEIDGLRRYLDIEKARFHDRLQVRYAVDSGCTDALVPALVMLPLAENSVKYALAYSEQGISLEIGATRDGDDLLLWLQDDGAMDAPPPCGGLGIGLANVNQQLLALYGGRASLEAGPAARGWRNVIRVPWRLSPP